jgi:hypothetical protein
MPIVIDNRAPEAAAENFDDVSLFTENDEPTLEAEVIVGFLDELDWDAVMEDEDVKEFVEKEEGFYKFDENGEPVACGEKDEGAVALAIESLDGSLAWQFADTDDLIEMFKHYVSNLPESTLEEKARKAVFAELVSEEALDEKGPFKKGAFRKMHAAGGKEQVNRMLGAMMAKGAIKKAGSAGTKYLQTGVTAKGGTKAGSGYAGGDYVKDSGYAPGTGSGRKRWMSYKGKKAAELSKEAKKARKAKKSGMSKVGYKVGTGSPQKKQSAKTLVKKAKAPKKSMVASDDHASNLTEGATTPFVKRMEGSRLAGAILESFGSKKPEGEKK